MIFAFNTVLFCLLVTSKLFSSSNCKLIIEIREDGHDAPECKKPSQSSRRPSCQTLDYVLDRGSGVGNDTEIHIYSGTCLLKNDAIFSNVRRIALIGRNKSGLVKIYCQRPNVGISFVRSANVELSGLELHNCRAKRNETLLSALHFVYSKNITISNAKFANNTGKGVSMLDTGGKVELTFVEFANNTDFNSGGGIYVEFTKCGAMDPMGCSTQMEQQEYVQNALFSFTNCSFHSNNYNLQFLANNSLLDIPDTDFTRGGGMAILLRGNASSNNFQMKSCVFKNNFASWGGGLNIDIQDKSNNNNFIFNKTDFFGNSAVYAGGGIQLGLLFYNKYSFQKFNKLAFNGSIFSMNKAIWGGGFSVRGTTRLLNNPENQQSKSLIFSTCTFALNYATVGSAFGLSTDNLNSNPVGSGTSYAVAFENCWIGNNEIIWTEDEKVIGQGAIYGEEFMLSVKETSFNSNHGTAVVLDSSSFSVDGKVTFRDNSGLKGGALAMFGNSWILLRKGSSLVFKDNHALEKGGAIYVHSPGPSRLAFRTTKLLIAKCFLRYDGQNADPNEWNTTVHFINNTAPEACGNSIFANTLQMCRLLDEPRKGNRTLNWKTILYSRSGNGFPEIATEAVEIIANIKDWHVSPAVPFMPSVKLLDERDNSVYGTIKVNISSHKNNKVSLKNPVFLVKDNIPYIRLIGSVNSKFNLSLITTDGQAVMTDPQKQSLDTCPPGYYQLGSDDCKCLSNETGITRCDNFSVYVLKGYWLGIDKMHAPASFTKPCPLHYCRDCSSTNRLNYECKYIPEKMCAPNRTGVLCSECKANHSVLLGSEQCQVCSNIYLLLNIPMVFVATAFVIIVMYFNFDAFSGYLNAYLYAYQTVNLMLVESVQLDPFIGIVIGITCLSGTGNTVGLCFFNGFNGLEKLGFNLAVPLFILLVLVIICFLLPERLWNKTFGTSSRMNSFGRAFSFVYVFCYTSLTSKTLDLLHPVEINGKWYVFKAANVRFFGPDHLPYAIPALFVLLVFVIGFPIVLLFTPFFSKYFQTISRMDPAFNALKNCFKSPFTGKNSPNYRQFAAFYFICRFILLLFGIFMEEETSRLVVITIACVFFQVIFTWCQPYILKTFNFWDTVILTNLCFISLINIILSVPYVLNPVYMKLSVYTLRVIVYVPLLTIILRFISHMHNKRRIKLRRTMDYERRSDDYSAKRSMLAPFLGRRKRMRKSLIPKRLEEDQASEFSEVV